MMDSLLRLRPRDTRPPLHGHSPTALAEQLATKTGESVARCTRGVQRLYRFTFRAREQGWSDAELTRAGLGRWIRSALLEYSPALQLKLSERAESEDGTLRLLLASQQDGALVESVLIPSSTNREEARTTLCVSSQVGCARACTFCETGTHGLDRQLSSAEIVDQYRIASDVAGQTDHMPPISNIVFMGMGEPMDNLDAVCDAVSILSDHNGIAFPPSRITVSTVGVAHKIAELFQRSRAELAISLNASNDQQRDRIMPINERCNLQQLREALLACLPKGRRVLFQYALFHNFNDSLRDADDLADYVEGIACNINVIPANPGPDPELTTPPPAVVDRFVKRLHERGIMTLVRRPRGRDVGGACGQLAGKRRRQNLGT